MIVKNEAPVIERCLRTVLPIIDHWVIVDTGSTDGTQDIIRRFLANVPGELYERPWKDFAYNRSEALELARPLADYSFVIDADDLLEFNPEFALSSLSADSYNIVIADGSIEYQRIQLVSNRKPWRYEGVLHEFLTCEGAETQEVLVGVRMRRNHDGARRRDPTTYQRDALVLEQALAGNVTDFLRSRYTFYLAQSYRDSGDRQGALRHYLARGEMGFWDQERFMSLYEAARLQEALNYPVDDVLATYRKAADACPSRAEALHGASRRCRLSGRNAEGYDYARRGLAIPYPEGGLFVEKWIYEYGLLDELAVNAYWAGRYRESLEASFNLLGGEKLPQADRERVGANARFALSKLPADPELRSAGQQSLADQHALTEARVLRSHVLGTPRILLAILAKQKEGMLPLYLQCIEALDYPKSSIVLYIRTNNNTDGTERILRDWVDRVEHLYDSIEFDATDVKEPVQQFGAHEWNPTRFQVLGHIRAISMQRALEQNCDFYFVADVDNFLRPCTLRELVALNLPIVGPLLRSVAPGAFYSNYHAEVDGQGYFENCDQYQWILNRWIRGVLEVPVIHTTYLVRSDVLKDLRYQDGTDRHEYVIFSDSARKSNVVQYIDNRQVYGYIAFDKGSEQHVEGGVNLVRSLLSKDLAAAGSEDSARRTDIGDRALGVSTTYGSSNAFIRGAGRHLRDEEVPPIHLINLDRSTDRLRRFKELNGHLENVHRVSATDGSTLDRESLIESEYINRDLPYMAGTLGCAMSHVRLWEKAVESASSMTIFEDDIVVSRHFPATARQVLSALPPDWDIIHWGALLNPLFVWVDLGSSRVKLVHYGLKKYNGKLGMRLFQSEKVAAVPLRLLHSFGMQGYSISPKGARAALEFCLPLRNRFIDFPDAEVTVDDTGIDVALCGLYPSIKAYICTPQLVMHYDEDERGSNRIAIDQARGALSA
jgi:GR25 family glycosyltransferase involved in LPS biosynthesis/glycosyltransferase involved in cell wall biosynthesis